MVRAPSIPAKARQAPKGVHNLQALREARTDEGGAAVGKVDSGTCVITEDFPSERSVAESFYGFELLFSCAFS
jgi:hypothetical protein